MRKRRAITQETFDELLAWLNPNREQAALVYEQLRRSLIKIFAWRGCLNAEDLTDETIDRITGKMPELRRTYQGDPRLYFYAVANNLIKEEMARRKNLQQIAEADAAISVAQEEPNEELEKEYECFRQCLEKLDPDTRRLILAYYLEEKQEKIDYRKELASRLGIAPNALRVRVFRIRAVLEKCIEECLKEIAAVK